jgi:xanthine dehydrogenase accessory factor
VTWWSVASEHIAQGVALVTICTVKGSAPREAGAKLLVWSGGQHGTVGGGQLEFTLVEQARKLLASGAAWRFQNYPLGPLLGQCCGGNVGILLERLDPESLPWLDDIAALEASATPYATTTRLAADGIVRTVAASEGGDVVVMRLPDAKVTGALAEGAVITEQVTPRPHLLLFGAGHVGRALAPIAATLPFHFRWFDNRPDFAGAGVTLTDDPVAAVHAAPPGSYFLVFTQSHALDYDLTRAVLARGDFAYCGLIGSATKRARFEKRLASEGIATARLSCPIGAIGLRSKLPSVLAVAIAAELLLVQEATAQSGSRPLKVVHAN